jgi:flagellar biosynthetic protein FlhB
MAEGAFERTEPATAKRRNKARSQWQVALSPEINPVVMLFTALAISTVGAPLFYGQARVLVQTWLGALGPIGAEDMPMGPLLGHTLLSLGGLLGPFFVLNAVVAFAVVLKQVGWAWNPELVLPDPSRIAFKGLSKILSPTGGINLIKNLLKIAFVLLISYRVLKTTIAEATVLPALMPYDILAFAAHGLRKLLLVLASALAVLAVADLFWVRWRHEQSLKMSRLEVKEEVKESEGDPRIRGQVRKAQREIVKRRMLADVKHADVVLTNPVHFAVALRYRPEEMAAPQVVAKGAGDLAQRIKDQARSAGVPIVERRALARALFRSVKVGTEIPPALYRAVAEILAYIYSLRTARPGEAT